MTTQQSQRPIKEFRAGSVRASIWLNESENDGRTVAQHSVRIEKRFRDKKTNEWRNTDYFFPNDLPRLRLVAEKAFEFIALRESDAANGEEARS